MTEYITKEAAVEAICDSKDEDINSFNPITRYNAIYYAIEAVPAADVVEVVRCKDCERRTNSAGMVLHCALSGIQVDEDDFCSCGERRSDNG